MVPDMPPTPLFRSYDHFKQLVSLAARMTKHDRQARKAQRERSSSDPLERPFEPALMSARSARRRGAVARTAARWRLKIGRRRTRSVIKNKLLSWKTLTHLSCLL
jgi:hypothetical protein